ncbi:follistatin-A-like isoform X1 [Lethenteron reissneri]|uniref:follistatin-A-like isoform X1 n=1 Tax=Lethenteron reissneri TaxID=7753 RepID=UPI002AB64676|nr:follistatin-A-like isoform X1 [Lethenteron reissneri]XP_061428523.1 follistatin-A-like isoform X1 [Lethenteron reissneri]
METRWNSPTAHVTLLLHLLQAATAVEGGICWLRRGEGGRCQGSLLQVGVSMAECCSAHGPGRAWSGLDASPESLFRWKLSGGATPCVPCSRGSCDRIECGPDQRCRVGRNGAPRCLCAPPCPPATRAGPVCASSGRTFRDECALLRARCRGQRGLSVQYPGPCMRSCAAVPCPGASVCLLDQSSTAHCVSCSLRPCATATTATATAAAGVSPRSTLCGNDGVTYPGVCHLRRATCQRGRSIGVAHHGPCQDRPSCADTRCGPGRRCLWDSESRRPHCVLCPEAPCSTAPTATRDGPDEGAAVCASDNVTYPSACAMREAACARGVYLEARAPGFCGPTEEYDLEDLEDEVDDEDDGGGDGDDVGDYASEMGDDLNEAWESTQRLDPQITASERSNGRDSW